MELLLTGRPITAAKAKEYGLINDVVPDQGLRAAVMALATEIAGNAPLAVQASKRLAQRIVDGEVVGDAALWSANLTELGTVFSSPGRDGARGPLRRSVHRCGRRADPPPDSIQQRRSLSETTSSRCATVEVARSSGVIVNGEHRDHS